MKMMGDRRTRVDRHRYWVATQVVMATAIVGLVFSFGATGSLTLFFVGVGVSVLLLLCVWQSARSEEKRLWDETEQRVAKGGKALPYPGYEAGGHHGGIWYDICPRCRKSVAFGEVVNHGPRAGSYHHYCFTHGGPGTPPSVMARLRKKVSKRATKS